MEMPSALARSRSATCSSSVNRSVITTPGWYQFDTAALLLLDPVPSTPRISDGRSPPLGFVVSGSEDAADAPAVPALRFAGDSEVEVLRIAGRTSVTAHLSNSTTPVLGRATFLTSRVRKVMGALVRHFVGSPPREYVRSIGRSRGRRDRHLGAADLEPAVVRRRAHRCSAGSAMPCSARSTRMMSRQ
jgi:hypothetical protein